MFRPKREKRLTSKNGRKASKTQRRGHRDGAAAQKNRWPPVVNNTQRRSRLDPVW